MQIAKAPSDFAAKLRELTGERLVVLSEGIDLAVQPIGDSPDKQAKRDSNAEHSEDLVAHALNIMEP